MSTKASPLSNRLRVNRKEKKIHKTAGLKREISNENQVGKFVLQNDGKFLRADITVL